MNVIYYQHYIAVNDKGYIIDSWSSGPHPGRDTAGAICINEHGGYQFRLFPGGEENPLLRTIEGVPLYRWDGRQVQPRSEAEIEADRTAIPTPPPSLTRQLAALALRQAQQDATIAQLQQVGAALMLQLAQAQAGGGEVDA